MYDRALQRVSGFGVDFALIERDRGSLACSCSFELWSRLASDPSFVSESVSERKRIVELACSPSECFEFEYAFS